MAHMTEIQTDDVPANAIGMNSPRRDPSSGMRLGVRRVSVEQEQADFAAWLREYRRWTQSGCCAPSRSGEIEWGGEGGAGH